MNPFIWIPALVVISVFQTYASVQSQNKVGHWGLILWVSALVPIWVFVAKHSKNMMWDVLAYDTTVFLTYAVATGIFTSSFHAYGWIQWTGLACLATGFILLHMPVK